MSNVTTKVNLAAVNNSWNNNRNDFVGAIDQGTSSTRFLVFTKKGEIAAWSQMEHKQYFPPGEDKVGWHEHDPLEIWTNIKITMEAVIQILNENEILFAIEAIGITNQRETTLAWNAETGVPYYNAIVWDDTRTAEIANQIANGNIDRLRDKTGLPLSSYSAGTRVKWLLDNVPTLTEDLKNTPEKVRFGTIDTWILYELTGKPSPFDDAGNVGGLFLTDVSNASRWLFCDINTIEWDQDLVDTVCSPYSVPLSVLPTIRASSEVYGHCTKESTGVSELEGVPVAAILGDQQAALFGQCAFEAGEAKNTYGTGMFLMMNTGKKPIPSNHGLLTTIAYKIGDEVYYGLEGSVSHSGSTIQWLRDQLQIIKSAPESGTLATENSDGLYFVPAFAGLFAPHWRSDARGCIVGMTASHHKGHICRAALEAAAYQAKEVFDAIYADSNVVLKSLKVDGGGTNNDILMQFQADIIKVPVVKPKIMETTSMGAAFCAGLAVGTWKNMKQIRKLWGVAEQFKPSMADSEIQKNWVGWKKAVSKSLNWEERDDVGDDGNEGSDEGFLFEDTFQDMEDIDDDSLIPKKTFDVTVDKASLIVMTVVGFGLGYLFGKQRN